MNKNDVNVGAGETMDSSQIFRALAEDAPVMLWVIDKEQNQIFCNDRWKEFIGLGVATQKEKHAWYEALHPEDKEQCLQTFNAAFKSQRAFEMEYRLRRKDGSFRYILDSGEPYIDKEGRFSGFIGSSSDITARKISENELKKSHDELIRHNHEMKLINQLNSYLQVCRNLQETYPVISMYGAKIFEDCSGALYLFNESRTMVESVAEWGEEELKSNPIMVPDECWALRQGKSHKAFENEGMISCSHVHTDNDHSYTCVPIIAQGEMLGVLHLQFNKADENCSSENRAFIYETRQRLAEITADNLALSLVSLKLREALKAQSIRDPLTQLFNRRYMEESLDRELARCVRYEDSLAIMMLDIDHFKKFNDDYGHDAGDFVISNIARYLSENFRSSDICCRFGGEEFLIIMPSLDILALQEKAEKIREGIHQIKDPYNGKRLPAVSVSIGLSHILDHGSDPKVLIKHADIALYESKRNGRNRVTYNTSSAKEDSLDDTALMLLQKVS